MGSAEAQVVVGALLASVASFALVACGGHVDRAPPDGGGMDCACAADAASIGDAARDDAAGADGDAGSTTDDAGSVASYPYCRIGCTTASDCATAGVALYDASHYACESSVCRWTGCQDDAECQAAFARSDYACRDVGGLSQCVETCTTASDCGSGTAAFDADNYECAGGVCRYTGCSSDAECAATFASDRYACRHATLPDTDVPVPSAETNCVLRCTTSADCTTASAAFDADNYECTGGACVYTGCNGDAECRSSFASDRYVCR